MMAALFCAVVALELGAGHANAAVPLDPVITGSTDTYRGFANDDFIAYTRWTKAAGTIAFARPLGGGTAVRLNPAGTHASTGGFEPGTNRVIMDQWGQSTGNLFFYDLDTDTRSPVPGVNTRRWETDPRISTNFIAFTRWHRDDGIWVANVLVRRRSDGLTRTVGTFRNPRILVEGSLGDRYLTFTRCNRVTCVAYIYDWETDTRVKIPSADGKPQYAPVVDEANSTAYFARSGFGCGQNVNIWRLPITLQGTRTLIVDLPSGIDTDWAASLTPNGTTGHMDLYVGRWSCSQEQTDIYVAQGVDTVP
jgi:hypothetical protein